MNTPTTGKIRPKSALSFPDADRLDREINRLAADLESLVGDIALQLYGNPSFHRLRAVQTHLKTALKSLDAAKGPARELWNDAAASADQGGRCHGE